MKQKRIKRADNIVPEKIPMKKNINRRIVLVVGLSLVVVNALPLIYTPISIIDAEGQFNQVFGDNWRDKIPDDVNAFFLPTQFNLFNYFLGFPQPDCNIDRNIQYLKIDNDTYTGLSKEISLAILC